MGDYTFNVANALSASYFMERFALERVTASYDLNDGQLEGLVRSVPPQWLEVTIHQHMPMFHMEHCLYCAFMSDGTDYTNCGRPCDRHDVRLRDRVGVKHYLRADAGCRNTVFNATAQTGADSVSKLLSLGVRWFRLEFMDEESAVLERTIERYKALLHGDVTGGQLWRELQLLNQLGVTRGTATHL
jgi:putative protease